MQTLAYSAHRSNIDELVRVRGQMEMMYGSQFVNASETDLNNVNETIRENINLIMPDMGWKLYRLTEIAKKEGLAYSPSEIHKPVLKPILIK
jgi:hypothetical protein